MKRLRPVPRLLALFAAFALLATPAAASLMPWMYDPPLIVTNKTGKEVRLVWQTAKPGVEISRPRTATIPAGATDQRVEPGLFWIVYPGDDKKGKVLLENFVYVSSLDETGGFAEQAVLETDEFTRVADLLKLALRVTVLEDGRIRLEPSPER
ncbi:hypothetical protein ACFOGJ_01970 [Marinibaculum pumilum]|uniref:Uncharacterized protein n=1 Tax=Marinibaculum pumilum TaxID=1766165 RepID=A0ABV7KUI8_9PROT